MLRDTRCGRIIQKIKRGRTNPGQAAKPLETE
jgi:hypothetical protein